MKKTTLLLAGVCLVLSCARDKIDFDMIDDLRFSPEMEAPLVKARLSFADLALKDSNFVVDSENRVSIKYSNDSIFGFKAIDFVNIPAQKPFGFPLVPAIPNYSLAMSLGTMGGVELGQTKFEMGFIKYELKTAIPFTTPVQVQVSITNGSINGSPMTKVVTLPAGDLAVTDSLDISSAEIDFSTNGTNFIGLSVDILNSASILPPLGNLDLTLQLLDIELESTTGNFGQRNINIPNSDFDFDISGIEKFVKGLRLTNPKIKLISTSTVGIDMAVATDFDGLNGAGVLTPLQAPVQLISGPQNMGGDKVDTLKFDRTNSGIVDFMAAIPTKIMYAGIAAINPQGPGQNFIHKNSRVKMGVEIDLPLELQSDNLLLEQTLEGIEFFKENPEEIKAANLIFYTKNGFPFDVNVTVALLDTATNDSIDGFALQLLTAPPVNGQGKVTSHSQSKEVVTLSAPTLENLKKVDKLRLRARVSTPNNGQQVVTFYTDYDLEIKIATQLSLNLKP